MPPQSLSVLLSLALLACPLASPAWASKPVANRTYVQSGPDGVFYARCIPSADTGGEGSTDIYQVFKDGDKRIDHYEWYAQEGVFLGWSPIAGKIGIMALNQETRKPEDQQVEFSFYLGGTHLKTWTTAALKALGTELAISSGRGIHADYRALGCTQIPGTNDYVFEIELRNGAKLAFDILTGDLRKK